LGGTGDELSVWPRNRDVEAGGGMVTLFWMKTEVRPVEDDADGSLTAAELYTLEVGTVEGAWKRYTVGAKKVELLQSSQKAG